MLMGLIYPVYHSSYFIAWALIHTYTLENKIQRIIYCNLKPLI